MDGKKKSGIYIYTMEYYSAMIKNEILPFQQHGWTLRALYLTGIPERKILYDLTYIYLNVESKKQTKKPPQAQRYREETFDCWQRPQNR